MSTLSWSGRITILDDVLGTIHWHSAGTEVIERVYFDDEAEVAVVDVRPRKGGKGPVRVASGTLPGL